MRRHRETDDGRLPAALLATMDLLNKFRCLADESAAASTSRWSSLSCECSDSEEGEDAGDKLLLLFLVVASAVEVAAAALTASSTPLSISSPTRRLKLSNRLSKLRI